VGVAPCTSLFRHFFVLVKSGKAKDHLGAYYFQMRLDSAGAYISSLGGMRWENWRADWVIVSTEATDCLTLPSDRQRLDRKQWRAKLSLAPEFLHVLDRIKTLAAGGLTSMHVVGDFLKRRITPLQRRARLCCWFTGSNDIGRIQHGPGTDLSWEELKLLVKGITSESFIPESLILPQGIPTLCDDPGLRTAILASLPTLDESGVAVRQTDDRDPHHGIRIFDALAGGPQPASAGSRAPSLWPPTPWTRAKGLQVAPPPRVAPGGRRKRGDTGCVALTGRLSWTLPLLRTRPKSVIGQLARPRGPAPRLRARRGMSVLRHRHHRIRRHHHHHRSCCHLHHLGVISPRGTSSNNHSSSSNNNSSGRPASRVAGRSRAPSKRSPFFP
jgi:hypothetical protein